MRFPNNKFKNKMRSLKVGDTFKYKYLWMNKFKTTEVKRITGTYIETTEKQEENRLYFSDDLKVSPTGDLSIKLEEKEEE